MATHSSIHAWRIPWMEEPGGLLSLGSQESDTTERLNHHVYVNINLNCSTVRLKLSQYCKSTIFHFKNMGGKGPKVVWVEYHFTLQTVILLQFYIYIYIHIYIS